MCTKIKETNELTAEKALQKSWDQKVPVDVEKMLKGLGIHYRGCSFSILEEKLGIGEKDAILGMALTNGNDLGILFSESIPRNLKNYVLAHELAHCCLHLHPSDKFHVELKISKDLYSKSRSKRRLLGSETVKEVQADFFAADILIPTDALKKFRASNSDASNEKIAEHFYVSPEIVQLKLLGLEGKK